MLSQTQLRTSCWAGVSCRSVDVSSADSSVISAHVNEDLSTISFIAIPISPNEGAYSESWNSIVAVFKCIDILSLYTIYSKRMSIFSHDSPVNDSPVLKKERRN